MKKLTTHGWFGALLCKVCGSVSPYGVCPVCNQQTKKS